MKKGRAIPLDCEGRHMSRYIDADLIQYEPMLRPQGNGSYEDCEIAYRDDIDDIPTADVRENVKGIWEIDVAGQTAECDKCHFLVYDFQARAYAFCPNCGADMRGEK